MFVYFKYVCTKYDMMTRIQNQVFETTIYVLYYVYFKNVERDLFFNPFFCRWLIWSFQKQLFLFRNKLLLHIHG